jgi:SAM-dependent methyltransferase
VSLDANARRFSGFADLYDAVRPTPPHVLADVLTRYAGGRVAVVVDLGSGTGLSTRWAATWSGSVVGVEPSDDMRQRAAALSGNTVRYVSGWSNDTGLADGSADIVLAVQALHWMDPESTFAEVARILRPGGVFAAIDCDWPPSVGNAGAEQAWHAARARVAIHERQLAGWTGPAETHAASSSPQSDELRPRAVDDPAAAVTIAEGVQYWAKGEHLRRMVASQRFAHCVEVAAVSEESGDADRFVQLFKSQGDYQALRRNGFDDVAFGVDAFADEVHTALGDDPCPFWFTYRARVGVTAEHHEAASRHE